MSSDDDSDAARRAVAHGTLRAAKIATGGPAISPANHTTDMDCAASYLVDVPMDPSRPTTLRFSYGDGAVEDFAVDQGTGVQQLRVRHQFREGAWSYVQVASSSRPERGTGLRPSMMPGTSTGSLSGTTWGA